MWLNTYIHMRIYGRYDTIQIKHMVQHNITAYSCNNKFISTYHPTYQKGRERSDATRGQASIAAASWAMIWVVPWPFPTIIPSTSCQISVTLHKVRRAYKHSTLYDIGPMRDIASVQLVISVPINLSRRRIILYIVFKSNSTQSLWCVWILYLGPMSVILENIWNSSGLILTEVTDNI